MGKKQEEEVGSRRKIREVGVRDGSKQSVAFGVIASMIFPPSGHTHCSRFFLIS